MTIKHVEFGKLLYTKLIYEKLYTVELIARRTNTPASTVYKYCEGTLVTPADFVSKVYNATKDIDFLDFVIGDTDKVLIARHRGGGEKTVLEETLDVASAFGHLSQSVQKAQAKTSESGTGISDSESRVIYKHLNSIIKEVEDVRTCIENMVQKININIVTTDKT